MKYYHFKWYRLVSASIFGFLATFLIYIVYDIASQRVVYLKSNFDFWSYLIATLCFVIFIEILSIINQRLNILFSWQDNTLKRFASQFIVVLGIAVLFVIPIGWFISGYLSEDKKIDYFEDALIIGGVVVAISLIYLLIEMLMFFLTQWKNSQILVEKFKKENIEYRFDRLKEQLNPHFLFNNLNTLYGLIMDNPEIACEFVLELSDIYRYILKNKDEEIVSLSEELEFSKSYAFLLSKRFPNSINLKIKLKPEIFDSKIPPMTIQMLIENAIKHNSFDSVNLLYIDIYQVNDHQIIIENNIQPKNKEEISNKVGLLNLKQRYEYLTVQNIEITQANNKFTIKLPVINSK